MHSKMNIIAIDTITPALSVSAKGPKGTATIELEESGQHAQSIIQILDTAVSLAGFSAKETELVVCPSGPGSFTGLRLAWSAAKAIQLSAGCPMRVIQALDCYARPVLHFSGLVASVLDAKKNRFYARLYRQGSPCSEPLDISPEAFSGYADPEEQILVAGPDSREFSDKLRDFSPLLSVQYVKTGRLGIARELLLIADSNQLQYTEYVTEDSGPLYVRKSDAENG